MTSSPLQPAPPPTPKILIRAPSTHPPTFLAPTSTQLLGLWHVTHSTLPLWKNKRNVTVTYGALEPLTSGAGDNATVQERLDDTVSYQTLTSEKVKTIRGVDTAELSATGSGGGGSGGGESESGIKPGVYNWRGSGFLKIASSHWEIIGYGIGNSSYTPSSPPPSTSPPFSPPSSSSSPPAGPSSESATSTSTEWAVTYFASTIFSPAGVDIYSRSKGAGASSPEVVEAVTRALLGMEDEGLKRLGGELYEVRMD